MMCLFYKSDKRFSFPFICGFTFKKSGNRGGYVLYRRGGQNLATLKARAHKEQRNRHILGHIRAVSAVVPAVVGKEDNSIILGDAFIDLLYTFDGIVGVLHIFLPQPTESVTCVVGIGKVQKEEVRLLLVYVFDSAGSDQFIYIFIVATVEIIAGVKLSGAANVAKLVPGDKECAFLFLAAQDLNDSVDGAHLRGICISRRAVSGGVYAMEE